MPLRPHRHGLKIAAGLATAVIAMTLAGCSPSGPPDTGEPDDGTTLTLWTRGEWDQAYVDLYNETHENQVEITIIGGDQFLQKVGAAAGAGDLPDLLASDDIYAINYADQGVYVDITDKVNEFDFKDDLLPAMLEAATLDGRYFAVPHTPGVSLMWVNTTLLDSVGMTIDDIDTLDGLLEASRAVHEADPTNFGVSFFNSGGSYAYGWMPVLAAAGEPPFIDGGATANLDTDAMRDMVSFLRTQVEEGLVMDNTRTDDGSSLLPLLQAGKILAYFGLGIDAASLFPDATFEWTVVPIPGIESGQTSGFIGGDVIGVTTDSEHFTQAWDFIQWSLSEEVQIKLQAERSAPPARLDLLDTEAFADLPFVDNLKISLETGMTPFTLPYGELVNLDTGPWFRYLDKMIFDGADIDDSLAELQAEVQGILDDNYN